MASLCYNISWDLQFCYVPRLFFWFRLPHETAFSVSVFNVNVPSLQLGQCLQGQQGKRHSSHLGLSDTMCQFCEMTVSIFKLSGVSNCHWKKKKVSFLCMEKHWLFFPNGFNGMKAVQVILTMTAVTFGEPFSSYCGTLFFFSPTFQKMSITVCGSLTGPDLSPRESVGSHLPKVVFFFFPENVTFNTNSSLTAVI